MRHDFHCRWKLGGFAEGCKQNADPVRIQAASEFPNVTPVASTSGLAYSARQTGPWTPGISTQVSRRVVRDLARQLDRRTQRQLAKRRDVAATDVPQICGRRSERDKHRAGVTVRANRDAAGRLMCRARTIDPMHPATHCQHPLSTDARASCPPGGQGSSCAIFCDFWTSETTQAIRKDGLSCYF